MLSKLHFVSQADQPYGSVRRCCSVCGQMVWPEIQGNDTPDFTDDYQVWSQATDRCGRQALESDHEG